MSSTWILEFVGICSVVLINVLDIVIWITVRICMIGIGKFAGVHYKHWVYLYGCVFWICHSCSTNWEIMVFETTYLNLFQGHFLLCCIDSSRPSEAIWQQELWQHWRMWWDVARRHQAITWNKKHLGYSPMGYINGSSMMQIFWWICLFWILLSYNKISW